MDNYGRVDTAKAKHQLRYRQNYPGIESAVFAAIEAADLYAADPSDERLALLNECLDTLPQRAKRPTPEMPAGPHVDGYFYRSKAAADRAESEPFEVNDEFAKTGRSDDY